MSELVRYDAMRQAIVECAQVDEVKELRDKALALEHYARQAQDRDLERQVREIRLRAEKKAGALLREQKETGKRATAGGTGANQHKEQTSTGTTSATLSDLGVSRDQSSKWQKLDEIPEEKFEEYIADPTSPPSTEGLIRRHELETAPAEEREPDPPVEVLDLFGLMTDRGVLTLITRCPQGLVRQTPDHMFPALCEVAPQIRDFLNQIEAACNERKRTHPINNRFDQCSISRTG